MSDLLKRGYNYHQESLNQLDEIEGWLNLPNRTEAIKKAIAIAHKIVEERKNGSTIKINEKDFDFFGI